jgi:uncharacterized membrane protein
MSEFIGKFHPLVVHLPIGFIVLTLILKILDTYRPNVHIQALLSMLLKLCFGSVLLATFTGYIMPKGSDFDETLLDRHFWSGVTLTVISLLMIIPQLAKWHKYGYWLLGAAITVAGHLGGSLTHGENFFNFSTQNDEVSLTKDGTVYQDIIYPIFHTKCLSCHNQAKSKGGLKMHEFDLLMKGGKSGQVIKANDIDNSELYLRLLLLESDEHHMPPKGKTQPSNQEIEVIKWWIENGARKDLLMDSLPKDNPVFIALANKYAEKKEKIRFLPVVNIPDPNKLAMVEKSGGKVIPLDLQKPYFKLDLSQAQPEVLQHLSGIADNVLDLQITGGELNKDWCQAISNFKNLQKLNLSYCTIDESCDLSLKNTLHLESLTLVGTKNIKANILANDLPTSIQVIYLYQSENQQQLYDLLLQQLPKAQIDTGGYIVPILVTDTTRLAQ